MCSPQMMAVDPDHSGRSSFQVMFSVFDQRAGRLVSRLTPFAAGPRHAGQFSAWAGEAIDAIRNMTIRIMCVLWTVATTMMTTVAPSSRSFADPVQLRGRADDHAAVGDRRRREAHFAERVLAERLEFRAGGHDVGVAVLAERE